MAVKRTVLALAIWAVVLGSVSADVELKTWFPEHPALEFHPGKVAPIIIGARNTGEDKIALKATVGNLALVSDPAGNVFNFTGTGYELPDLASGEERVVEYHLPLPLNLPPREFFLHLRVLVMQGDEIIPILAFNETINVIEEAKLIDIELLGLYIIFIGFLAAIAYVAYNFAIGQGWIKKSKPMKKTQTGASDKAEWLKGTVADERRKFAKKN